MLYVKCVVSISGPMPDNCHYCSHIHDAVFIQINVLWFCTRPHLVNAGKVIKYSNGQLNCDYEIKRVISFL